MQHARKNDDAYSLIVELHGKIFDICGFYFDIKQSLGVFKKELEKRRDNNKKRLKCTNEHVDNLPFFYGRGEPDAPTSFVLHRTTQGRLRDRNNPGGLNHKILSDSVIENIYSIWNDEYRPHLARLIEIEIKELSSEIFGDIRLIRNSIVHHGGIAKKEVEKCKVINFFKEGDKITFTDRRMEDVFFHIFEDIDRICLEYLDKETQFSAKINANGRAVS